MRTVQDFISFWAGALREIDLHLELRLDVFTDSVAIKYAYRDQGKVLYRGEEIDDNLDTIEGDFERRVHAFVNGGEPTNVLTWSEAQDPKAWDRKPPSRRTVNPLGPKGAGDIVPIAPDSDRWVTSLTSLPAPDMDDRTLAMQIVPPHERDARVISLRDAIAQACAIARAEGNRARGLRIASLPVGASPLPKCHPVAIAGAEV